MFSLAPREWREQIGPKWYGWNKIQTYFRDGVSRIVHKKRCIHKWRCQAKAKDIQNKVRSNKIETYSFSHQVPDGLIAPWTPSEPPRCCFPNLRLLITVCAIQNNFPSHSYFSQKKETQGRWDFIGQEKHSPVCSYLSCRNKVPHPYLDAKKFEEHNLDSE